MGSILSAAMMMRITFGEEEIASEIENAVKKTREKGLRTSDITLVGEENNFTLVGTKEITAEIIANL